MNVIGVIQARMASTRLPGKILAPLAGGRPLLAVLAQRVRAAGIPLWLATTTDPSDEVTSAWGDDLGLTVFRGHPTDVLSRFAVIARASRADWIVRLTADDPFTDSVIVSRLLDAVATAGSGVDLIDPNGPDRTLPLGYAPQAVRCEALLRMDEGLPRGDSHHRSHVVTALEGSRRRFFDTPDLAQRPKWRWTVDTAEDLAMARRAFAAMGAGLEANYQEFVDLLDECPSIVNINAETSQKRVEEG